VTCEQARKKNRRYEHVFFFFWFLVRVGKDSVKRGGWKGAPQLWAQQSDELSKSLHTQENMDQYGGEPRKHKRAPHTVEVRAVSRAATVTALPSARRTGRSRSAFCEALGSALSVRRSAARTPHNSHAPLC
jgi:hypothetical protein